MMPHIPQANTPILLVEQTIEYLGYQSYAQKKSFPIRWLLNFDIKKIIRWERFYWRQANLLITMSDEDRQYIQEYLALPQKVRVVSNGVDTNWFAMKKRSLPQNPTILYVGTFKWLPNVEAVQYLVEQVWPRLVELIPNARLKIVGNAPTKAIKKFQTEDDRIKVVGRVADIRDSFCSAHLLLAPVFSGKGTRYKILEAMASGTPVVATSTAVEGLNIKHKQQALVSDDPQQMAEFAHQLIEDRKLWQQLSTNGKKFVKSTYDWKIISHKLDKIYQSVK
jgi:glycosyltransferase involved in cell wall biosynthesis